MQTNLDDIRTSVTDFLRQSFRAVRVGPDEDIFASGLINSLFALQLIEFIEGRFQITVTEDDLELDNFRAINAIAGFVERKLASNGRSNGRGA